MNKRFPLLMALTAIVLTITCIAIPTGNVSAGMADGSYETRYEMKEASSYSTLIADGYFTKPATLTVENGTQYIQLTVTSAEMVKSLSAPSGPVDVVSDNGDTRTVKFPVDDLSQPVNMSMHVVVPEEALPGGYDMEHTARAVFDVSGLPTADAGDGETESSTENDDDSSNDEAAGAGETEENPPTGDSSNIALFALLLVGSGIALFAVRKFSSAQN